FLQSDFYDKLDIIFTTILIVAGIITIPSACFVYYRMLTLKSFQNQYLMKLFVLNGASDASKSFMWQTTFFISLNRLLSLTNQSLLKKVNNIVFITYSNFRTMSLSFQFTIEEDVYAFIPQIPKPYRWTSTPALIYQATLAAGTLLVNVGISYFLVKLRKEYSSKRRKRPEQGLIISSFVALLMHALNDSLKHASKSFKDDTISYVIPLTIAISTTLPFWTMIIFAHSLR
ncbi:hypothetical protein PMAYCL1PPCAC_04543, partial [Pristionchus mayeri]